MRGRCSLASDLAFLQTVRAAQQGSTAETSKKETIARNIRARPEFLRVAGVAGENEGHADVEPISVRKRAGLPASCPGRDGLCPLHVGPGGHRFQLEHR